MAEHRLMFGAGWRSAELNRPVASSCGKNVDGWNISYPHSVHAQEYETQPRERLFHAHLNGWPRRFGRRLPVIQAQVMRHGSEHGAHAAIGTGRIPQADRFDDISMG